MDEKLRQLLDQIPERAPRSKLEPHAEVIRELRKKRRTYSEIAAFFREHLQLSVAPSTLHEFVKVRARQARQRKEQGPELSAELAPPSFAPTHSMKSKPNVALSALPEETARERMRAVRAQSPPAKPEPSRFEFDPQKPLTLNPPSKEK